MTDLPADFGKQGFGFPTYLLRGRLFRRSSFDISDPSGSIVLRSNPPALLSNALGIFSVRGDKLVACHNKCSLRDAYFAGVFRYEFEDTRTGQIVGGLKGIRDKNNPDSVEWQMLDSQQMQSGHIREASSRPAVRYCGKPMHDVVTGFVGDQMAFLLNVNTRSLRFEMSADFSMDGSGSLDRRLGIAIACLFAGIKRTPSNDS